MRVDRCFAILSWTRGDWSHELLSLASVQRFFDRNNQTVVVHPRSYQKKQVKVPLPQVEVAKQSSLLTADYKKEEKVVANRRFDREDCLLVTTALWPSHIFCLVWEIVWIRLLEKHLPGRPAYGWQEYICCVTLVACLVRGVFESRRHRRLRHLPIVKVLPVRSAFDEKDSTGWTWYGPFAGLRIWSFPTLADAEIIYPLTADSVITHVPGSG